MFYFLRRFYLILVYLALDKNDAFWTKWHSLKDISKLQFLKMEKLPRYV